MNRGDFRNENKFNDTYVRERASDRPRFARPSCISRQDGTRAAIIFAKIAGTYSPLIVK